MADQEQQQKRQPLISIADLGAHKLKNVPDEERRDYSGPKVEGYLENDELKEQLDIVLDINMENWLDLLGQYTFETRYVSLTVDHARALIQAHEETKANGEPSDETMERLKEPMEQLQAVIEEWGNEGVFVKLSSRSAKDAGIFHGKLIELYQQRLRYLRDDKAMDPQQSNTRMIAVLWAALQTMKVGDAKEAFWQFAHSRRIWQDMHVALEDDVIDRFHENICIRRWCEIDVALEFRGFVYNRQLNALSQYNQLAFFQELHDQREELESRIRKEFSEDIEPLLFNNGEGFTNYVVDFGITDEGNIVVIELNPFLDSTSGALFNWRDEIELLKNGPFEFRLTDKYEEGFKANLLREWRDIIEMDVNLD